MKVMMTRYLAPIFFSASAIMFLSNSALAGTKTRQKSDAGSFTKEAADSHKSVSIGAEAGFYYVGAGVGAGLSYQPSKRFELSGSFFSVNGEQQASGSSNAMLHEYLSENINEIDLLGRFYFGRSFNVSAGLGYAMVTGDYGFVVGDAEDKVTAPYHANATLAILGVGNMWKLHNGLVIGCDWFSVTAPLSTSLQMDKKGTAAGASDSESSSLAAAILDLYEGKSAEDMADDALRKQFVFRALVAHIGWSF